MEPDINAWTTAVVALGNLPAPGSLEIAGWVGCLFFLAAGWNQVEKFLDRRAQRASPREILPQPLPITRHDGPVPESLCRQRHDQACQALARMREEIDRLRQERREDAGEWRQTIAKVDREVGELKAGLELSNRHLARIDAKLDRVIERA